QLHHDVRAAVVAEAEVVDLDDAGVADGGGGARLVEEAPHDVLPLRQVRVQHLDRGRAIEPAVARAIDDAQAALAEPGGGAVVGDHASGGRLAHGVPPVHGPGAKAVRLRTSR